MVMRGPVVPVPVRGSFDQVEDLGELSGVGPEMRIDPSAVGRDGDRGAPWTGGAVVFNRDRPWPAGNALEAERGVGHQRPAEPRDPGEHVLTHVDAY
jgi:hypothetical protein